MADRYDTLDPARSSLRHPAGSPGGFHLDERTNSIETDYLPVVGWAIGAEIDGGRAPVIWNIGAQEIGIPAELEAADDWSGFLDTYLFDPDTLGAVPEVDETATRKRLMEDGDFQDFADG